MKRIILIGNGFDLAHDLPTDYVNFIKWYLKQCFNKAKTKELHNTLLMISQNENYREPTYSDDNIDNWVEDCYESGLNLSKMGKAIMGWNGSIAYPFNVTIVSQFFRALVAQCSVKRWVDVEATFYGELTTILDSKGSNPNIEPERKEKLLASLNADMRHITKKLQEYLLTLEEPLYNKNYERLFKSDIMVEDLDSKTKKYYHQHRIGMSYQKRPISLLLTTLIL